MKTKASRPLRFVAGLFIILSTFLLRGEGVSERPLPDPAESPEARSAGPAPEKQPIEKRNHFPVLIRISHPFKSHEDYFNPPVGHTVPAPATEAAAAAVDSNTGQVGGSSLEAQALMTETIIRAYHYYYQEQNIVARHEAALVRNGQEAGPSSPPRPPRDRDPMMQDLKYYGGKLEKKGTKAYRPHLAIRYRDQYGMQPMDCLKFILLSLSEAANNDYYRKEFMNPRTLAAELRTLAFETLYIAENTQSKDRPYGYHDGSRAKAFTRDVVTGSLKNNRYFTDIDYLVTDADFHHPLFRKFLNGHNGFVFFQEGYHVGLLHRGNFLEVHWDADPAKKRVFGKSDFLAQMNNDDPYACWQSAVLFVPKGSVEDFILDQSRRMQASLSR